jgi:hypothetical protein
VGFIAGLSADGGTAKATLPATYAIGRLSRMVLATSEAFKHTLGLIGTFGGIGVVVNVIVVYIAVQIRGERRENREYLASKRPPGA